MSSQSPDERISSIHRVDSDGLITSVDENWLAFAARNDWPVQRAWVVGRHWHEFVASSEVRAIYDSLMDYCSKTNEKVSFNYRCDSSSLKRWNKMTIQWLRETREHEFCNIELDTEKRTEDAPVGIRPHQRNATTFRICSMCLKVNAHEEDWVELDDFAAIRKASPTRSDIGFCYGICPQCREDLEVCILP